MGPTGTGKSAYVQQKLMHGVDRDRYISNFLNFSAQTSANMTQVWLRLIRFPHFKLYILKEAPIFWNFNVAGFCFLRCLHTLIF